MFIYNVKFNSKSIIKITFIVISIIVVIFFLISLYKIFATTIKVRDNIDGPEIAYIKADNYTNILKSVYEDLDTYVGQKICFSGYVYRNVDFTNKQFVLARDMLMSDTPNKLIVGFLCSCSDAKDYEDGTWIEIVGEITKGNYHGEIPLLKITQIKRIDKPIDEFTYPPDATYIPTGIIY